MIKSETTKKIASNTLWQLIGKIVSMSITVTAVITVTRVYGRQGYGEFSLMQNWPALFFIIVDFGLNAIASRELSKDFSKAGKYFFNILIFRLLFCALIILGLSVALIFFPYSSALKFGIILNLFLLPFSAVWTTTNILFQVKMRYDLSVKGYIGGYILVLFLVMVLAYFRAPVAFVSFSYVLGGILTLYLNILSLKRLGINLSSKIDALFLKDLFMQSLPLGVMFVFSQINFKADSILLSVIKVPKEYGLNNTESVAVYNLPYKIFEVMLVLPTFFMNSAYPVFVRHSVEGAHKIKTTFFKSLGVLFVLGILSGIVGAIFSKFIINALGGSEFAQSILVLQILLLGLFVYFVTSPISWLIVTLEKQNYLPYVYVISSIFNITANIIFIPKYSFYSSAVITHLSEIIILILLVYFAQRAWKLRYAS